MLPPTSLRRSVFPVINFRNHIYFHSISLQIDVLQHRPNVINVSHNNYELRSQGRIVVIVTTLTAEEPKDSNSIPHWDERFFISPKDPNPTCTPPSPICIEQCVTRSTALKRPVSENDHSPPPSAEVKNGWNYTPSPYVCHYGEHRDNFVLIF